MTPPPAHGSPPAAPLPAPPAAIPAPRPEPERSIAVKVVAALVALLVLGAGSLAVSTLLGGSKATMLPDSVGSFRRIDSPNVGQALDAFHAQAKRSGLEADLAVYGTGSTARILLAWIRDATVTDPDTALTAFASGFARGFGGTIDMAQRQTRTVGGVTFVCAPVTGNAQTAICLWQQREVFYILFDPRSGGNLDSTLGLSATARRAIG